MQTSSMDTSSVENCLAFDLNSAPVRIMNANRNTEFEGGDVLVDERKSLSGKEEPGSPDDLIDKLNQMRSENKKLAELLIIVCENYNTLQKHLIDLVQNKSGDELPKLKKRKFDAENTVITLGNDGENDSNSEEGGSPKRPKEIRTNISRVYVRVDPSDTSLVVKDGYHWRKYGQKVTKDNPSPRAYYKCSFAPSCQVKKKVQRSVADPSILVATYEGDHNHQHPLRTEMLLSPTQGGAAALTPSSKCRDFIDGELVCNNFQRSTSVIENNTVQQFMVDQMASSLTRNPSFTAALAAAISGRILSHDSEEK